MARLPLFLVRSISGPFGQGCPFGTFILLLNRACLAVRPSAINPTGRLQIPIYIYTSYKFSWQTPDGEAHRFIHRFMDALPPSSRSYRDERQLAKKKSCIFGDGTPLASGWLGIPTPLLRGGCASKAGPFNALPMASLGFWSMVAGPQHLGSVCCRGARETSSPMIHLLGFSS